MSENDIIAAYVRNKYPELIKGADFQLFKLGFVIKEAFDSVKRSMENIDFTKLAELANEFEQKCGRGDHDWE